MRGDEPLLMKLSVNITPHGTMIFIPAYWSFDAKRDVGGERSPGFTARVSRKDKERRWPPAGRSGGKKQKPSTRWIGKQRRSSSRAMRGTAFFARGWDTMSARMRSSSRVCVGSFQMSAEETRAVPRRKTRIAYKGAFPSQGNA